MERELKEGRNEGGRVGKEGGRRQSGHFTTQPTWVEGCDKVLIDLFWPHKMFNAL